MTASALAFIATIALVISTSATQKPQDDAIPPSGNAEMVVIRGCLSGGLLKDLHEQKTEAASGEETAVVYRLTGEKKLLHTLQKEHQNQVLDVAGVLTLNPDSASTVRSKDMGKARVFVGSGRQETSEPGKPPSYPTIKVMSFDVARPGCQP